MTDNNQTTPESAPTVTEIKIKRKFDWKKAAKVTAYSVAAVLSAVVIFKLANEPEIPKPVEIEEQPPKVDENVA